MYRNTKRKIVIASMLLSIGASSVVHSQNFGSIFDLFSHRNIVHEINRSGHITINQSLGLQPLVTRTIMSYLSGVDEQIEESVEKKTSKSHIGYRIQVFDDNNPRSARSSALSVKTRLESSYPSLKAYMVFDSPYWRVRVGDFRSRAEAESVMAEINRSFPELKSYVRIVRSKINVVEKDEEI